MSRDLSQDSRGSTPDDASLKRSIADPTDGAKPKRKRKTFSCQTCRKLKTRCDFEKEFDKCHRCGLLKLECSLSGDPSNQVKDVKKVSVSGDDISEIQAKLDMILNNLTVPSKPVKRSHVDLSPFKLISKISQPKFQSKFHTKSLELFNKIYTQSSQICLSLSDNFLTKAHFWIIPGGISQITHEYTQRNPFITLVFILISLSFDHKEIHIPHETQFQSQVFRYVTELIGLSMIWNDDLTDHDLEGMVYLCNYQVVRQSKGHDVQKQWDLWVFGSHVLKLIIKHFKFLEIKQRVDARVSKDEDIFHLRIWNALCCSHLGVCLGFGYDLSISDEYLGYCSMILEFPDNKVEDEIKYVELGFLRKCYNLIRDDDYLTKIYHMADENVVIEIKELKQWKQENHDLITRDFSQILKFCYDYFHICFMKKMILLGHNDYSSIRYYLFELVDKFLSLDPVLIKGSPNYLMNQLIYTCLELYELMKQMEPKDRLQSVNYITKVYWKLNQIGEDKNQCTMDVGKIIKGILDKSNNEDYPPLHDDINHGFSNDGFRLSDERGLNNDGIPNVEMYTSFEDFFKELFK